MRYFNVDLLDLGTRRLSWRRLGSLLRYLPREAVTVQLIVGDEARWSDIEHLLAFIGDTISHQSWMFLQVNAKNAPKKPPSLIPRPGDAAPDRAMTSVSPLSFAELEAAIERQTGAPRGVVIDVKEVT